LLSVPHNFSGPPLKFFKHFPVKKGSLKFAQGFEREGETHAYGQPIGVVPTPYIYVEESNHPVDREN
jgi:hypothetical protein